MVNQDEKLLKAIGMVQCCVAFKLVDESSATYSDYQKWLSGGADISKHIHLNIIMNWGISLQLFDVTFKSGGYEIRATDFVREAEGLKELIWYSYDSMKPDEESIFDGGTLEQVYHTVCRLVMSFHRSENLSLRFYKIKRLPQVIVNYVGSGNIL